MKRTRKSAAADNSQASSPFAQIWAGKTNTLILPCRCPGKSPAPKGKATPASMSGRAAQSPFDRKLWPHSLCYEEKFGWWKGSVRLIALQAAKIRRPRRAVELLVRAGAAGPTQAQAAAYEHLQSHQEQICAVVMAAVTRWARAHRRLYQDFYSPEKLEALLPQDLAPGGLLTRLALEAVSITDRTYRGLAFVEYLFNTAWDSEHNLMVVLHRERLKHIGYSGEGW